MNGEKVKEHYWRPTREFFEQDPRATELRNICLEAVGASKDFVESEYSDAVALEKLFDVNQLLHEREIEPEMHVIDRNDPDAEDKRSQLESDPVVCIEWVGGQVRSAVMEIASFSGEKIATLISEHDIWQGEKDGTSLVDMSGLDSKTQEALRNVAVICALEGFIDYSAGPSETEA